MGDNDKQVQLSAFDTGINGTNTVLSKEGGTFNDIIIGVLLDLHI